MVRVQMEGAEGSLEGEEASDAEDIDYSDDDDDGMLDELGAP